MSSSQNQVKSNSKRFKWALDYTQKQKSGDVANPPGFISNVSYHHADTTRDVDPNLIVKRSWDFALGPIKQFIYVNAILKLSSPVASSNQQCVGAEAIFIFWKNDRITKLQKAFNDNYFFKSYVSQNSNLIQKWIFAILILHPRNVPMNLFLMYMAGNSISIFPIMMVGMLFMRPIKAMVSLTSAFKMIEGSHHIVQKLSFVLGNLVNLAIALYKCQSMGLLPTHTSDWLAFVEPQERVEFYGGGISLDPSA